MAGGQGCWQAGLNASYHDGGLQWAHRIAGQIENRANVVLALLMVAPMRPLPRRVSRMTAADENSEYRFDSALAHAQTKLGKLERRIQSASGFVDRKLARLQANRARVEARLSRSPGFPTFGVHVGVGPRCMCRPVREFG